MAIAVLGEMTRLKPEIGVHLMNDVDSLVVARCPARCLSVAFGGPEAEGETRAVGVEAPRKVHEKPRCRGERLTESVAVVAVQHGGVRALPQARAKRHQIPPSRMGRRENILSIE
jgi:hypothetical protein